MTQNNIFGAPKTLELDQFVFNPISTINPINPNEYLIHREDYEIKEEMNKCIRGIEANTHKLIPKNFLQTKQDDKLFLQKNEEKSIIVTRITSHQLKICELIDEFWHTLTTSPISNEPIDFCREKKLFSEFIVRFSRNYVYELERNIDEIRFYEIDHYSYFERSTNHLVSKVCNLFTIIVRGLQTYKKYLPNLGNRNPDKLPQFMELVLNGLDLCIKMKIFDQDDLLIEMLKDKAEGFIAVINQYKKMPSVNRFKTFDATSATKHISIPMTPRYDMYDSKSKKMKQSKSVMNFSKASQSPKNTNTTLRSSGSACSMWEQNLNNFTTMYKLQDSLRCSGSSSDYDGYKVAMTLSKNDLDMKPSKEIEIEFALMNFDEVI